MAAQTTTPTPMTSRYVPDLGWSKYEAILYCTQVYSAPVQAGFYGVHSERVGMEIFPPALNFPQGALQGNHDRILAIVYRVTQIMKLDKVAFILPARTVLNLPTTLEDLAIQLSTCFVRPIFVFRDASKNLHFREQLGGPQALEYVCEVLPDENLVKQNLIPLLFNADYIRSMVATGLTTGLRPAYIHLKEQREKDRARRARRARPMKNQYPKPPNSWILFLNERYKQVKKENKKLKTSQISVIVAKEWKDEFNSPKPEYEALAKVAKKQHAAICGKYESKVRKSSEIKRRNTKKEKTIKKIKIMLSTQSGPDDDQHAGIEHDDHSSGIVDDLNDCSGNLGVQSNHNKFGQAILRFNHQFTGYSNQVDPAMDEVASAHLHFAARLSEETSSTMIDVNNDLTLAPWDKDLAHVADIGSSDYAGLANFDDEVPTYSSYNDLANAIQSFNR